MTQRSLTDDTFPDHMPVGGHGVTQKGQRTQCWAQGWHRRGHVGAPADSGAEGVPLGTDQA